MKIPLFSALLLAAIAAPAAATLPDISAKSCNGCSEMQFESKAISFGVGKRYLYDFSGRTLRYYQVNREPKPGGGYLYEAIEIGADPAYLAYFDQSLNYRDQYGSFSKTLYISLPGLANAGGHSNDSVFSVVSANGGASFGAWLGQYLATNSSLINLPDSIGRLNALIQVSPGIKYDENPKTSIVVVDFRDGVATFQVTDDIRVFKLKPDTARDSDQNPIPSTPGQISYSPYVFPGGAGSSNFSNFGSLMNSFGIPIGTNKGSWNCGTAAAAGSSSRTCVLVR